MSKETILLVEDDEDLAMITQLQLKNEGYQVIWTADGAATMELLEKQEVDLILLDVMLPDCDGHELCERIKESYNYPVIFMSCLGDSTTIVNAFRGGGCDYLVKPVNIEELVERIEKNKPEKKEWEYSQFIIDTSVRMVYQKDEFGNRGELIELSPTEYKLLMALIRKQGELVLYKELYREIWKQGEIEDIRTLMVHVSNLRKKIDYQKKEIIKAVRGAGYIFQDV